MQSTRAATLTALLAFCLAAPASAQSSDTIRADRPGIADSSFVVGNRVLQFESGLQWERRSGEALAFVPTLLRFGLGDRFEVRVEGNTFATAFSRGIRHDGLSPMSLGFKAVLVRGEADRPQFAVMARLYPPSGTGIFKTHQREGQTSIAGDWRFADRWSLEGNAGIGWYGDDPGRPSVALLALTLSREVTSSVQWFVDAGGEFPEVPGGTAGIIVDAGIAYIPRQNWQFDVSAGTRAHGDTPPRPFIGIGLAYRHK